MSVHKSETSEYINKINSAIKSIIEHTIYIFRLSKAKGEIVIDI